MYNNAAVSNLFYVLPSNLFSNTEVAHHSHQTIYIYIYIYCVHVHIHTHTHIYFIKNKLKKKLNRLFVLGYLRHLKMVIERFNKRFFKSD